MASVYAAVDTIIATWVGQYGFKLVTEFNGEARFFYVTGGPQECFQIWVGHPANGEVDVGANDVETIDDAALKSLWTVPEADIGAALDKALAQVRDWIDRPKGPGTWAPHT